MICNPRETAFSIKITRMLEGGAPYTEVVRASLYGPVESMSANQWDEEFVYTEEGYIPCQRFLVRVELPEEK